MDENVCNGDDGPAPGVMILPASVIRVRLDGVLLACNDAALGLFGVGERRDVLNTSLADRIAQAQRAQWREFITRCWAEGAGSFACDLVTRTNEIRPVLMNAVALTEHPDGFESLLVHLRDEPATEPDAADRERTQAATLVELQKKLEQSQLLSLQKEREYGRDVAMLKSVLAAAHAARTAAIAEKQELEPLKLRVETVTAEHVRLQALVAEYEVDRTRIAAGHQAAIAALENSLAQAAAERGRLIACADDQARELDRRRAEHQQALVDLEAALGVVTELRRQLSEASAEHRRLVARVEEHERERHNLIADHHRALADVQARNREMVELRAEHVRLQAVVDEYEIDRTRAAADRQAAVDTLEQSLAQALAEQSRMAARVEKQTREQDLMRAEHHQALADFQASKDAALADLQSQLARTSVEHAALTERVAAAHRELNLLRAEHQRAHERLIADHQRALADIDTGTREALDQLRLQHSEALDGQRRLATRLEEHERERAALIDEHRRILADMETAKGAALAELHSQLSQVVADHRRLATHADEHQLELNRLRAEHDAALTDVQNRSRGALAELRSELAGTATEHARILAERAAEHERERDRMIAEHGVAIANLQAGTEAAAAELRSQLSTARAEHHRLTAMLEDADRERERVAAAHQRTIADLQASQRETVAECERVLMGIKQALLVRDASRRLDVDRRLGDGIDDSRLTRADGERFASLQRGLTSAVSRMQAALNDGTAPKDDRVEDADLAHEPFDDADDAFVHQLLESLGSTALPAKVPDPKPAAPAEAVSKRQAPTAGDDLVDDVFDAQDAAFARGLMDTHRAPEEPVEQADAAAPQALPRPPAADPEEQPDV